MSFPALLDIDEIQRRLTLTFPEGLEMRPNLVSRMAARTVFVFLYGGMVEGADRYLRPSHIYFYTADQVSKGHDDERDHWIQASKRPRFRPEGERWYADTTREPIRDETIRYGLLNIGAVDKKPGVAVTSSAPIYFLKADFAGLFDPALADQPLADAIHAWQRRHLTPAARARMALIAAGKTRRSDEVEVLCPDGTVAKLSPGPSSLISKAVVEQFAQEFLESPVLLWLSESGSKTRVQDVATAKALGLNIDAATVLPDIILANLGATGEDTALVFIEVVASDGPMNQQRKNQLLDYVAESSFPVDQCHFGTAFIDRADSAFRKALPTLAWGTFAWFSTEPLSLMLLFDKPFNLAKG